MDINQANRKLEELIDKPKYETMIHTASIITKLLEEHNIKPIIVGGLSVEIYTQQDYTTRDIDFVSDGYAFIQEILLSLRFKKENRHFYRSDIEIAIEIPDNYLEGSLKKVIKVDIEDGNYVYLISIEDIILDRIRAGVHWRSEDDQMWALKLLASNYESVDTDYLKNNTQSPEETELLQEWLEELKGD